MHPFKEVSNFTSSLPLVPNLSTKPREIDYPKEFISGTYTIGHFRIPQASFSKRVLMLILSYANQLSFIRKFNSFSCEWKLILHMKRWAPRLTSRKKPEVIRKWPITFQNPGLRVQNLLYVKTMCYYVKPRKLDSWHFGSTANHSKLALPVSSFPYFYISTVWKHFEWWLIDKMQQELCLNAQLYLQISYCYISVSIALIRSTLLLIT